jgi:GNAT superfamily N-acetyltransferase
MNRCAEITTEQDLIEAYELFVELNGTLDRELFLTTVKRDCPLLLKIFGLNSHDVLVSVAAAHVITTIEGQRVLWIFDMVTSKNLRSQGLGTLLIEFIESYARENEFAQVRVHSLNHRTDAHRFYQENGNFSPWATIFRKDLK